ncbi:RNA polymerase sigma factor [Micromonospora sp. NPDC005171]|uniref:RNA polymerase sigma factor n=1 Tax=Micromonospora sp. NPDC005171 TaxID=3156866 RepID=UPI0033B52F4E
MPGRVARPPWPGEQVVAAAQAGDEASIAALVSASHPHVQQFAYALCASDQDAEDAAQEALIVLFRKIGTLRAAAALSSWMFQIVRNECIRRARTTVRRAGPAAEPTTISAEEDVLRRLEAERVAAAIAALPADQRCVLVMRDVQGMPGGVVAKRMGLSTAAMKSRLHRARAAVRGTGQPRSLKGTAMQHSFTSRSVPAHLARGILGFGLLIGSVALIKVIGPISLILFPAGLVALRGCPTCWAIGLAQTISRGRLKRTCQDGSCRIERQSPDVDRQRQRRASTSSDHLQHSVVLRTE